MMIGLAVLVLLLLAGTAFFLLSNKSNTQTATEKKAAATQEVVAQKKTPANAVINTIDPPVIAFNNWTGFTAPAIPAALNNLPLKQTFTQPEVQALAQKLETSDSVKNDKKTFTSYAITQDKISFMIFNMQTGEFVYNSTKGVALPGTGTLTDKSYAFLQSIGWYDPSVKVSATYKDRKKNGVTYVELHRNWTAMGAPILNSVGLLNIPLEQPLSTLAMTTTIKSTPKDEDIYESSDNKDGMARSTDFNTMTLAIDDATQTLRTIKSTLRPMASTSSQAQLISYQSAVEKLLSKKYSFIYTTPSGGGTAIDWKYIYPGNLASAQEAKVTESMLAYLEETPTTIQTELKPFYIFRGYAQLDSGYRVTFTAAVPATDDNALSSTGFSWAKNAYAAEDPTQKQGTFDSTVEPTALPTIADELSIPDFSCKPGSAELNPVYSSAGLKFGWAPYTYWKGELRNDHNGYWYYIPEAGTTASMVEGNLDAIITALQQTTDDVKIREERKKIEYDINQNLPPGQKLSESGVDTNTGTDADTTQKQGTFYTQKPGTPVVLSNVFQTIQDSFGVCPIRLTGSSPTVFVYGRAGENLTISPTHTYTYADPILKTDAMWNVTVNATGDLMVNGTVRPYLYYEYDRVAFTRPEKGWNIQKNELRTWVASVLAPQLGLNNAEIERTIFEINHAAKDVSGSSVFIGIISKNELASKLPLQASKGALERIHFYVGHAHGNVEQPVLKQITRPELMILELGSHSE